MNKDGKDGQGFSAFKLQLWEDNINLKDKERDSMQKKEK